MENECNWKNKKAYYYLYTDTLFLKSVYSQLFNEYPDVGMISYIGANTHRVTKDYSAEGEVLGENNNSKRSTTDNKYVIQIDKGGRKYDKQVAGLNVCDSNEASEIREYANIEEIKQMNNMIFYNKIIYRLIDASFLDNKDELYYTYNEINIYEGYSEQPDLYLRMGNDCIWLKREFMNSDITKVSKIIGKVHMLGYIIGQEMNDRPKIIKAISLFV